MNLNSIITRLGPSVVYGERNRSITGWTINKVSHVKMGHIFLIEKSAFSQEKIHQAFKRGARAVVVDQSIRPTTHGQNRCLIKVPNTTLAIYRLVRAYRSIYNIPIIGVTGSVGKSTTKEMIASILQQRWKIVKTTGNANLSRNIVGFLSKLYRHHNAAVFEMGMNRFGEIQSQCFMAKPTIGVMTRIGEAHVGNLKNSIYGVIKAKQELINGLQPKGILILNRDDKYTSKFSLKNFKGRIFYYSIKTKTNYWASHIINVRNGIRFKAHYGGGIHDYFIPVFGIHNVANALGAIAVAHNLGFSPVHIRRGLSMFEAPKWRLQLNTGIKGSLLINDSYNANSTSMCAGINVLKDLSAGKQSIAVLGDMLELGLRSKAGHRQVGKYVATKAITRLFTVGKLARDMAAAAREAGMPRKNVYSFNNRAEALQRLRLYLNKNTVVLFKASRRIALDKLVKQLMANKAQRVAPKKRVKKSKLKSRLHVKKP